MSLKTLRIIMATLPSIIRICDPLIDGLGHAMRSMTYQEASHRLAT